MNEVVKSDTGDNYVFQRQKRVLKVSLFELLPLAQKEIGFKYSLREGFNNIFPNFKFPSKISIDLLTQLGHAIITKNYRNISIPNYV